MPFYEYRCGACGHELEVLQKMSAEPLVDCPSCSKATLIKLVSAAGFQLKGSGWYVTDFRDGDKSKKDKSDSQSKDDKTRKPTLNPLNRRRAIRRAGHRLIRLASDAGEALHRVAGR